MKKEKIYRQKDKIFIEIDYWTKRFNPYIPNEDVGQHKTLIGFISKDESGNDELGFALVIDMTYKDKGDQFTPIKYHFWGTREEFEKLCKKLKLSVVYY